MQFNQYVVPVPLGQFVAIVLQNAQTEIIVDEMQTAFPELIPFRLQCCLLVMDFENTPYLLKSLARRLCDVAQYTL